jgi:ATP-binding cassette subfamily B protein
MKGRTTFVIAHRLATIRNASRILVFQEGRIIESGTFDELYRGGGFFSELVEAQFGNEAPLVTALQSLDAPVVPQEGA